jgi:hypothetical protein
MAMHYMTETEVQESLFQRDNLTSLADKPYASLHYLPKLTTSFGPLVTNVCNGVVSSGFMDVLWCVSILVP